MIFARRWGVLRYALALVSLCPAIANAEATELRIARQLGLAYLQIHVMQDLKLVEKYAQKEGIRDLTVTYTEIGSPSILNDGILSGRLDMVTAGPPPFLNLWDRTKGNLNVRILAALNMQPMRLNTNNPAIKTVCDFTSKDRIAVPGVKTSTHAIMLSMAAEKCFGKDKRDYFDPLQAPLSHPDAVIALTSGHSVISGHFATIPYQNIELENPHVHTVISSYELTGGPATLSAIWLSQKFYDANPKIVRAVFASLEEATRVINTDPDQAADSFLKMEKSVSLTHDKVVTILKDPEVIYTLVPQKIMSFATFMRSMGLLKNEPTSWKDLVFPMIYDQPGS